MAENARDQEREALETVFSALEPLDEEARARVLAWILDRFRYGPSQDTAPDPPPVHRGRSPAS
jgi:hypothetical protein